MKFKKKHFIFFTFAGDLAVTLVLTLAAGWHWLGSLLAAGVVMWLVRLIWLNPQILRFILMRLLHTLPIILAVIALGFFLIQLAPGDTLSGMALNKDIPPEDLENFRRQFGLSDPWYVQFVKYLWNILHGNFGYSHVFKAPVAALVGQRTLNTLLLTVTSLLIAWGFSIPAGVTAAVNQYKWKDQAISVFAFFGLSIPNFFLAFLLLYFVTATGNWLPPGGMFGVDVGQMNGVEKLVDLLRHMAIPVFVIATSITASLTRIMRANMLEILGQQYITTARAKGLKKTMIIYKHALRNAVNPMITMLGFSMGSILGGAALVEMITAWPGLGKLILSAILQQDLYLVIGSLFYSVILLAAGNLLADILLAFVDPRVRIS